MTKKKAKKKKQAPPAPTFKFDVRPLQEREWVSDNEMRGFARANPGSVGAPKKGTRVDLVKGIIF